MAIDNEPIWRAAVVGAACVVGGAVGGCEKEAERGADGLVSSMFRGGAEEEKETVVVVVDRSGGGAGGDGDAEGGEAAEAIDPEKVNVVFVYADGMDDGATGGQVIELASFPTPDEEDMRFGGEWVRRVYTDELALEIRMELRADGSYLAEAEGHRVRDGERERARVEGVWDARGDEVVVQVHETSSPRLFPKGMIEVLGEGRVGEGVWTFLDTHGVRRTARRVRIENTPAA